MTQRELVFAIPGDLAARTGGYGYDRRMLAELEALGWRVRVLGLGAGYPMPSPEEVAASDAAFAALPDGARVLVDGLAFGAMDALAAREGGRLRLCALVHHPLALETGVDAAQAAELAARERRALARARAVIATSRTTADALVAQYGVDLARLSVVPPGTERPSRLALREARVGRVRIVAVGSLIPRKGFDVLIAALGLLHPLSWQLRIVGGERDAATAAALRGQVRSLHLDDRVRFVGEVADTAPELADADVFALPSRHEGYGMVFAEAMAHGLPVVACRAGAVPEVVPDTAGLLVPVDDVQALADALRRLIGDAGLRTRLSAGALRAARALPGWTESARVLARALEAA